MTNPRRSTRRLLFLFGVASLPSLACAAPVTHEYTVTVDYALRRLYVEARFPAPVNAVTARSRNAGRYLLDVRGCDDDAEIRLRNRRMLLPDHGIACLNYTVDLERAAADQGGRGHLSEGNVSVSPAYWMWRPSLASGNRIRVEFRLPEGMRVSVPWQALDDGGTRYLLGQSPESASAPAVFGRFAYRNVRIPGAVLRVALLDTGLPVDEDKLFGWVQAAATDVSLAYGRFPNPSPQVVVVPVAGGRSSSPVPFGRVVRDGGETVELFVNPAEPLERYLEDWTATHEFSHLLHPYLESDYHWITEGLAQYYQNVLLARAGAYGAEDAWQKLYAGFQRGRESRPELSPNEAASGNARNSRMKVYWSGAALALMADVELREHSGGKQTLDAVLDRFQACCLPSERSWTGPEFFAALDDIAGDAVFMPLYHRYADTAGFPDTEPVFERLGIRVKDGKVRLRSSGELLAIRDAITQMDEPAAAWRGQLVSD